MILLLLKGQLQGGRIPPRILENSWEVHKKKKEAHCSLNVFKCYGGPSGELCDGYPNTNPQRGAGGAAKAARNTSLSFGGGWMHRQFLVKRNAELITRSAHQEGVVYPSPSQYRKSFHYPHKAPCCPFSPALIARGHWGLLSRG